MGRVIPLFFIILYYQVIDTVTIKIHVVLLYKEGRLSVNIPPNTESIAFSFFQLYIGPWMV